VLGNVGDEPVELGALDQRQQAASFAVMLSCSDCLACAVRRSREDLSLIRVTPMPIVTSFATASQRRLRRGFCVRTVRSGPNVVFQGVRADGRRVAFVATVRMAGYVRRD
jgi:hypothetical protein